MTAVILATGIAVAVIAGLVGTVFNNRSLSIEEETLFAGIIGGIVAALAGFLASKENGNHKGKDDNEPDQT
jgi:hypothetical protein